MSNNKLTTLAHLTTSMESTKVYIDAQDAVLSGQIAGVIADVENLVAAGGEKNILEGVKVNGQALTITDKMVDLLITAGEENGTISFNGAAVAITGLASLAYKSEITEDELSAALKASIAAKATQADLDALTIRVGDIESAGYQNAEQVQTAIQAAIAASGHAHFEEAETVPSAEDAQENVMYLVLNADTGNYDIYALVGDTVKRLDDTTVDLAEYAKTADVTAAISGAIAGLNIDQYATDAELTAAIERITAVEELFDAYYTKTAIDEMFASHWNEAEAKFTDETEAQAIAAAAVEAAKASDADVSAAINGVFQPAN